MRLKSFSLICLFISSMVFSQQLTPLEKSNFTKLTSYNELVDYIQNITRSSKHLSLDTLAKSVEGRTIYYLKFSEGEFRSNTNKLKVLIFAQQHGNEHSGKEGALLLLEDLASGKLNYLLKRLDILIVPQMNPDGSENNKRRNGNNADLNRNHQILTEPEVLGLHKLFNKYLPESTIDVHEYYPFDKEWTQYGYRRDWDETIGTLTNPNISKSVVEYEKEKYLPFIKEYLTRKGFSFHEYVVGGPPPLDRMRFSTVWINDGRQSFGSLNSFSFIQEGKNGIDSVENLKHRAYGQYTALKGFLEFNYENAEKIKKLIRKERNNLIEGKMSDTVPVRMEHVGDGSKEKMNMISTTTLHDTTISLSNFHPLIKNLITVKRPKGYLISKSDPKLIKWLNQNGIIYWKANGKSCSFVSAQKVDAIKKDTLEEDELINPVLIPQETKNINLKEFYFIPSKQLYSNFLVQCLEPASMFCLYQYEYFRYLLKEGSGFTILRVEK